MAARKRLSLASERFPSSSFIDFGLYYDEAALRRGAVRVLHERHAMQKWPLLASSLKRIEFLKGGREANAGSKSSDDNVVVWVDRDACDDEAPLRAFSGNGFVPKENQVHFEYKNMHIYFVFYVFLFLF